MFGLLTGLCKIALSPLKGVERIITDTRGSKGEENQGLSILSMGIVPLIKGTAEGIKEGVDDIFEE